MATTDPQLGPWKYPKLASEGFNQTSPKDKNYNCIALAAGDTKAYWWPDIGGMGYWPINCPRAETLDAFIETFGRHLGYAACNSRNFENGFEKVAIYALGGAPKHMARQMPSGVWKSKLGKYIDIEHTLQALEGPHYGFVVQILKRPQS